MRNYILINIYINKMLDILFLICTYRA